MDTVTALDPIPATRPGLGPIVRHALMAAPTAAAIALLVAAPWLDQNLVICGWLGVAAGLLLIDRLRGWRGEGWSLAAATAAIATAFHWSPKVMAYSMNTNDEIGLAIAAPIMLWDALRLVLPFWFAARIQPDPLRAWLPAGLLACVLEAVVPAVFPWKLGYSQIAWPHLIQSVDLFGPEFSTFVLYAHAGLIVWLVHALGRAVGAAKAWPWEDRSAVWAGLVALIVCAANAVYGFSSMASWSRRIDSAPALRVALVQSNPEDDGGIDSLRTLTRQLCSDPAAVPDLVCWPECSGGSYEASLDSLADPERVLKLSRPPSPGMRPLEQPACPLLFGGKIYHGHPQKPRELYQSAILIDRDETILGCYHKRHLMPFGEYVPGEDWYPDIKHYFPMQDDLTEGAACNVLDCGTAARLGVMLCYEDMIPAAARTLAAESANVLVSLINGAAFTAPLTLTQHRLLAQMRAVENRRCLVRCAATGQTCVISPLGTVTASLPLHTRDVLSATVPLLEGRTLANRIGPLFPLLCGAAVAALIFRRLRPVRG